MRARACLLPCVRACLELSGGGIVRRPAVGWRGAGMAPLRHDTGPFTLKTEVAGTKRASRRAPVTQVVAQASGFLQHYTSLREYSVRPLSRLCIEEFTPSQIRDAMAETRFRIASRNGPPRASPTRDRGERYRLPNLCRPQATPRRDSPFRPRISAREFLVSPYHIRNPKPQPKTARVHWSR